MIELTGLTRQLNERINAFAQGALQIFTKVVPEANDWSKKQQKLFTDQATARFAAMLAVVEQGNVIDDELVQDLQDVGKSTALANASLSQLLLVLRISRDILIANAIDIDKTDNTSDGQTIATFLERLIPAVDSMVDSITVGYWSTCMRVSGEDLARSEALLEGATFGAYEADIDGLLQYVNPAFVKIVGLLNGEDVLDKSLGDVMRVVRSSPAKLDALFSEPKSPQSELQVAIDVDGEVRNLLVQVIPRREDVEVVGYCGIVRYETQGALFESLSTGSQSKQQENQQDVVDLSELVPHIVALQKSADSLKQASDFLVKNAASVTSENVSAVAGVLAKQSDRMRQDVESLDEARRTIQWPEDL